MKKSISMLLFVLISMVSFSQTELYVSVDGSSVKKLSNLHINALHDTIFVESTASTITYSITSSNGDSFTLCIAPITTVATASVVSNYTCTMTSPASPATYYIAWSSAGSVANNYFKFVIKHKPLNITATPGNNSVQFSVDSLYRLNYTINNTVCKGIWEYKFDQSPNMPTSGTSTVSMHPNFPAHLYNSTGVYYFHVRAWSYNVVENEVQMGFCVTSWNTYSIQLTYVPTTTTSISEIESVSDIKVYPNPAINEITVQYSSKNMNDIVSIYSISGQHVTSTAVESTSDNKVSINIESFGSGIYFVRIGSATYKFVKQ